ncbi:hypothetical protein AX15_007057 [Amanita polypyramis BW_CC]|nr:hypothetical protein AX15_007057 [Amanita polypyramis BW_CC]
MQVPENVILVPCSLSPSSSRPQSCQPSSKVELTDLVAKYGSSSSTAWLEFDRYHIWRPESPVPESSFLPVQGYMVKESHAFAWGNPLVSDPSALRPTAHQFIEWAERNNLRPAWICVDEDLEEVLASEFKWGTVSCVYDDVVNPEHVIEMTGPRHKGVEGVHVVKDLKRNLRRAEKAGVYVEEVKDFDWTPQEIKEVEHGIEEWKANKTGLQIASTTLQPWLDMKHRRYWLAKQEEKTVGVLILTPTSKNNWLIKNAVSFPHAPRGTSEKTIFTVVRDLYNEELKRQYLDPKYKDPARITFGISASKHLEPIHNLSGWGINAMGKTYGGIASAAGLLKRGEFRSKFDTFQIPKYVCFPPDGFGIDGALALLKVLKK